MSDTVMFDFVERRVVVMAPSGEPRPESDDIVLVGTSSAPAPDQTDG